MCGRPPRRKGEVDVRRSVECSHVFGLLWQRSKLLALMKSADRLPYQVNVLERSDPLGLPGVSPSQAANWRPQRKSLGSGALAAIALAVIGPIPGMVASRPHASGPLRRDDPKLAQMPPQGVDQHRSLADQEIAGLVQHQHGLLGLRLHGDAHCWPGDRLSNRFGVGRVRLAPLHVGFHISWGRQPLAQRRVVRPGGPVAHAGPVSPDQPQRTNFPWGRLRRNQK